MNRLILILVLSWLFVSFGGTTLTAQKNKKQKGVTKEVKKEKHYLDTLGLVGLKFRNIGPALTSGRISDFAINPSNPHEYYIATSSGGVWKTNNAGTTFQPLFDGQGSYSIGCVTMDPNNPNLIWVGTGENNNQRSVGYGDGIYKSEDGGNSWQHMGLKESEHIGSVVVDPRNSNVVYVAAIGPLWKAGGDRGVYKTTDGGMTWDTVLYISEHTGVNDIIMDPRNPDVLYATAYQRRRHVFTYLGGGPESGIYKTTDGGANWKKVNTGLPSVDLGRIGLAFSEADPEVIYAIVEAAQGKGGFYRSMNRGASWEKRSGYSTSGNYYQEIITDPKNPDKVFAMNTWISYSVDGGKTFKILGEDTKHVDNHCMWIDPNNTNHLLVGCDGGIYESWDHAKTWDFKANLPVTQFYKVAVDNSEPFYYVYGGTQDNFSLGGPSRTITAHGITNADWFITHGGDGFESQVDPDDPNIVYTQSQYGVLARYDRSSGEEVGIQPKARKGENAYRWNWDAPLAVSHHQAGRVYFAANKLFRSDDRGNSWEVISDDLTRQINRNELEVMGRVWSFEAIAKNGSTSPYGTIVAFSESPINANLLFVGTDDGLIQITEDGGQTWRQVGNFPGVPERTYVNAVYASQHNENVVYAVFNHHKYGDFSPYVYKSMDKGNTWTSITSNLPVRGSSYTIEEDHVDANLLFVGTEFGAFFSNDGGGHWTQLKTGLPTVAVRDMAIQRRENDLVLATFGRGFFILDDYSPLRQVKASDLESAGMLFAVRDPLLFEKSVPLGLPGKSFQGDSYYAAENLGPEALIRFYLKDNIPTLQEQRRKMEKEQLKNGENNAYPTYEALKAEREETQPQLLLSIKNSDGVVVKKMMTKPKKGVHTIKWDLRYESKEPISFWKPSFYNPFAGKTEGTLVEPGVYSVSLATVVNGVVSEIGTPQQFTVKPLNNTTLPASDRSEKVAFQQAVANLSGKVSALDSALDELDNQLKYAQEAIKRVEKPLNDWLKEVDGIKVKMRQIRLQLNGDRVASILDMDREPSISNRLGWLSYEQFYSTAEPTQTHRDNYAIIKEGYGALAQQVIQLQNDMETLQNKLKEAGAPYTPGRKVELGKN